MGKKSDPNIQGSNDNLFLIILIINLIYIHPFRTGYVQSVGIATRIVGEWSII